MSKQKKNTTKVSVSKSKKLLKKKKRISSKLTGVRKIQQVLTKYYNKRYPTYTSAKERAVEINSQMLGEKYTVSNILSYERVKRAKRVNEVYPTLSSNLTDTTHYFDLVDYPNFISQTDSRITFISPTLFNGEIQGGSNPDYNSTFKPFVDFCDTQRNLGETDKYGDEWFVKCTDVYYNNTLKRYECKMLTVDGVGNEEDYGFDKSNIDLFAVKPLKSDSDKDVPKDSESSLETKSDIKKGDSDELELKRLELELEKQKTEQARISLESKYMDLFDKGVITKDELKKKLGL